MPSSRSTFWTKKEQEDLFNAWEYAAADTSARSFAASYAPALNRSVASVLAKINDYKASEMPASNYGVWDTPPKMEGDAFILMDAHIPYHHAEFINRCLAACKAWGIKQIILGGDALDFHAFNKFPENFENDDKRVIDSKLQKEFIELAETMPAKYREKIYETLAGVENESGNISEELKNARQVLKAIEEHFESALYIMGNHEQRVTRILEKALDTVSLSRLIGTDTPKWKVSPYYWCELISGGEKWQIEHPINSGKGSSKRLAPKYNCHIVMGHNHHFNITTDPSGTWLAIEPGMGADEDRMAYVNQRHNAADKHMVGALIIRDGKPTPLNRFTDWAMFKGTK